MSQVFADTFYFLALLNKNDEAHARALQYSAQIEQLITTEWVLTELADGLASSRHRSMFLQTRQELAADADVQVSYPSTRICMRKASVSTPTGRTRDGP